MIRDVALGLLGVVLWALEMVLVMSLLGSASTQPAKTQPSAPVTAWTTSVPELDPDTVESSRMDQDEPAAEVYYSSCAEARKAGAAPLDVGDPGYRLGLDRDRDGKACDQ